MRARMGRSAAAAAVLVLAAARVCLAAGEYEGTAEATDEMPLPIVFVELKLQDSTTNAWSMTAAAVEAVRQARGVEGLAAADKAALDRLASGYNDRLAPGLHDLRHTVFFTRVDTQVLHLSLGSIGVNARHGRASVAMDVTSKDIDPKGAPQPVDFASIEEVRGVCEEHARLARDAIKAGLLELRTAKVDGLNPAVAAAYKQMVSAFDASLAVAEQYVELDGPNGLVAEANGAGKEYFEASNKALKPLPDEKRKAIHAFNAATPAIARLEFALAKNAGQARFLHGELEKLGKL